MDYPDYKETEGGNFIKLKSLLQNEGDQIELKCVNVTIIDGKDSNFGCSTLKLTVTDTKGEEKVLTCDAPDEKNEFQGSQVYRGVKDNNIQPGDTFFIGHGGRMNNRHKTVIYGVSKDVMPSAPDDQEAPPQTEEY